MALQSIAPAEENPVETALLDDVNDETTLAEMAQLACTTHKMGKPSQHHRPKKKPRLHARSGGFIAACTPCGYILDAFEFMGFILWN
eukprot:12276197-Karenia_brevis.AAC.1